MEKISCVRCLLTLYQPRKRLKSTANSSATTTAWTRCRRRLYCSIVEHCIISISGNDIFSCSADFSVIYLWRKKRISKWFSTWRMMSSCVQTHTSSCSTWAITSYSHWKQLCTLTVKNNCHVTFRTIVAGQLTTVMIIFIQQCERPCEYWELYNTSSCQNTQSVRDFFEKTKNIWWFLLFCRFIE